MNEELISLETSWLAKEKGYKTIIFYSNGDVAKTISQSLLQRWLREVHSIIIEIQLDRTTYPKYCFDIYVYSDFGNYEKVEIKEFYLYKSYEEALEQGLLKGLKLIKNE